ncbi:OmpA-like domain-containing protein [Paraburkholderia sacchari]
MPSTTLIASLVILLKGIELKRIVLLTFFLLSISRAFACSGQTSQPGPTRDINFDFNSSAMSNSEVFSLANWIVDTGSALTTFEGVSVVGLADARERNPQRIAEERAKNVKHALDMLGVRSATAGVIAHVYKPAMPNSKYEPTGTRAEVTLIPACPNN